MEGHEIAFAIMTIAILIIFAGFFIWGIKSGQFKNVEEIKYKVIDKKEENDE